MVHKLTSLTSLSVLAILLAGPRLQAQQPTEDGIADFDNSIVDQLHGEIENIKFQKRLQELSSLPQFLKETKYQLHQTKQLQILADKAGQKVSQELESVKNKLQDTEHTLNEVQVERSRLVQENLLIKNQLIEKEGELNEKNKQIEALQSKDALWEEKIMEANFKFQEKVKECDNTHKALDAARSDAAHALAQLEELSETNKRRMLGEITELKTEIEHLRASYDSTRRERDDIRLRVELQMSNSKGSFDLMEARISDIRDQISTVKSSFSLILTDFKETKPN